MTVCHGSMAPQADDTEETNKTLVASDAAAKAQTMTFANMQSFFFYVSVFKHGLFMVVL